jgi:RNA polymerase sigma factor (sigma-70 family)
VATDRKERFRCIFEEHSGSVYTYALRRTGSPEEAKDVVGDTFLTAWRRLDCVPEPALPWLLGAAHGILANHRRAAANREHLYVRVAAEGGRVPVGDTTLGGEHFDETEERTRAALERLAEADREALRLLYWDGLSGTEAARALGCTRATFLVRAHRARRRLREILLENPDAHALGAGRKSAWGESR